MRSPLKLVWSPRSLSEVALACSNAVALCVGGLSAGIAASIMVVGLTWGLDEPFPTVGAYLESGLRTMWRPLVLFIPGALVVAAMVVLLTGHSRVASKAAAKAYLLAPVTILAPMAVWLPAAVVSHATHPNMGTLGGVPGWMRFWPFHVLGGCWWPPAAVLWTIGIAMVADKRIRRWAAETSETCTSCGYDRRGLAADATCPECGTVPAGPNPIP